MHPSINTAVLEAVRDGIATSCSLMVTPPAAAQALQLLQATPAVPFGIHFTLTRDGPGRRWAPVAPAGHVPSLVDREGLPFTSTDSPRLLAQARLDDVEHELRAQLDVVTRSGLAVVDHDFLDSFALNVTGKLDHYVRLLRCLPAGLSEWAVHPTVGEETAAEADLGWAGRRSDHDFLVSSLARRVLDEEGIAVIDYRSLQRAWTTAGQAPPGP
jgi:predicted glycoside hydrolase/deacetylase ChbG (UPF0249 family)